MALGPCAICPEERAGDSTEGTSPPSCQRGGDGEKQQATVVEKNGVNLMEEPWTRRQMSPKWEEESGQMTAGIYMRLEAVRWRENSKAVKEKCMHVTVSEDNVSAIPHKHHAEDVQ